MNGGMNFSIFACADLDCLLAVDKRTARHYNQEKSTKRCGFMTEGKIYSKISLFALPIFIGQLFQQFYNVADSLVVGRYLGKQALAAVSSSGSLIFLLVGFINGVFVGAGVVIGRYYGARENGKVHTAVHTTTAFAVLSVCQQLKDSRGRRTRRNKTAKDGRCSKITLRGLTNAQVYSTLKTRKR